MHVYELGIFFFYVFASAGWMNAENAVIGGEQSGKLRGTRGATLLPIWETETFLNIEEDETQTCDCLYSNCFFSINAEGKLRYASGNGCDV